MKFNDMMGTQGTHHVMANGELVVKNSPDVKRPLAK